MKSEVHYAIQEIRETFPAHEVQFQEDQNGGAYVKVCDILIGARFKPDISFVAFHITFQYPHADVYPHYLVPDLCYTNGTPLNRPFQTKDQNWGPKGGEEIATMLSRRSNNLDPATDSACSKLLKVIEWMRSQ